FHPGSREVFQLRVVLVEACLSSCCRVGLKIESKVLIDERVESGCLLGCGRNCLGAGKRQAHEDGDDKTSYERQGSFDHSMLKVSWIILFANRELPPNSRRQLPAGPRGFFSPTRNNDKLML